MHLLSTPPKGVGRLRRGAVITFCSVTSPSVGRFQFIAYRVELNGRHPWSSPSFDLTIEPGRAALLAGPIGSGKSLLFQSIANLKPPLLCTSGAFECDTPHPVVALVPQDPRLVVLPTDGVGTLLRTAEQDGPKPDPQRPAIELLLSRIGLDTERLRSLTFRDLSASERHRLLLCLALRKGPHLLLYDGFGEVLSPEEQEAVLQIIVDRQASGMSLLAAARSAQDDLPADWQIATWHSVPSDTVPFPLVRKRRESSENEQTLLVVEELRVGRDEVTSMGPRRGVVAVDGVSFTLRQGESMAVLGASGSGKSTLLEAISGLHRPRSGRILFDGTEIVFSGRTRNRLYRQRVQLVFQDAHAVLDGQRTVAELLSQAAELARHPTTDFASWLERLDLPPRLLDLPADSLSTGEAARIDLARSLLLHPDFLLLDGPRVAGLGTDGGALLSVLQAERSRGMALLFATNDPTTARSLADRVLVLHAGHAVELGPTQAVLETPLHPATRTFLTGRRPLRSDPRQSILGCPFIAHCGLRKWPTCAHLAPPLTSSPTDPRREVACHFPLQDQTSPKQT